MSFYPPPLAGEVDRRSAERDGETVGGVRRPPFRLAALGTSPASGGG